MELFEVGLISNQVRIMSEFYAKVLGVKGDDFFAEIRTGGVKVAVFSSEGMERLAPDCMRGAGYGSFTLGFQVDNVDVEFERLKRLNVDIVKPPTSRPWGARSFWFRDPDGNIMNFVTPAIGERELYNAKK
ncbi:putative enzyme related to lactoylglutathione lyase [Fontibacillus phaseoli]|uniref:Putative enzyme related to lactoylglutathione lyase n=1 Tax=Fontibacillus phaseoli TaxID=1416533 RepID=A0A369BLV3_9BACL|nr:VOC family protein [Fontibacillus phaseoli]RCX21437.1 putative enzyme related to lactoylglutathione lyase [Fontibacillus phaseoli]